MLPFLGVHGRFYLNYKREKGKLMHAPSAMDFFTVVVLGVAVFYCILRLQRVVTNTSWPGLVMFLVVLAGSGSLLTCYYRVLGAVSIL